MFNTKDDAPNKRPNNGENPRDELVVLLRRSNRGWHDKANWREPDTERYKNDLTFIKLDSKLLNGPKGAVCVQCKFGMKCNEHAHPEQLRFLSHETQTEL